MVVICVVVCLCGLFVLVEFEVDVVDGFDYVFVILCCEFGVDVVDVVVDCVV